MASEGALETDARRLAECAASLSELRAIRRRLEQFASASRSLTYVGFLGHYSAGKSSTINSIFELTAEGERRQTDFHPTDVAITYCTHTDNRQYVLGAYRRGEIQVGSYFVDHELLKDFVVIDTPGAGDTDIETEMVRDFVPIFDHIVYVVNAAIPIDRSELNMLHLIADQLNFIPFTIVVTRSDEFTIDKYRPISEDNIDYNRRSQFTSTLLKRLSAIAPGLNVSHDSIIFIDNQQGYGVEPLRRSLFSAHSDPVALHSAKIRYFRDSIILIRDFFIRHSQSLVQAADSLLEIARTNDEEYNSTLTFYIDDLQQWWTKTASEFDHKLEQFETNRARWHDGILKNKEAAHSSLAGIPQINFMPSALRVSKMHFDVLVRDLERQYHDSFQNYKSEALRYLKSENALRDSPIIDVPQVDQNIERLVRKFADNSAFSIDGIIKPTRSEMSKNLIDQIDSSAETVRAIVSQVRQRDLIQSDQRSYAENSRRIADTLYKFVQQVHVYVSAITAIGSSTYIEQLSLAPKLNELGMSRIDPSEQDAQKEEIVVAIYKNRDDIVRSLGGVVEVAIQRLDAFQGELLTLRQGLDKQDTLSTEQRNSEAFNSEEIKSAFLQIGEKFDSQLNRVVSQISAILLSSKQDAEIAYKSQVRNAIARHWKRIRLIGLTTGAVIALVLLSLPLAGVSEQWSFDQPVNCLNNPKLDACGNSKAPVAHVKVQDCGKLSEIGSGDAKIKCTEARVGWWISNLLKLGLVELIWAIIAVGFGKIFIREDRIKKRSRDEYYNDNAQAGISKIHDVSWVSANVESETGAQVSKLGIEIDRVCRAKFLAGIGDFRGYLEKFEGIAGSCLAELSTYSEAWVSSAIAMRAWYSEQTTTSLPLIAAADNFKTKAVSPCLNLFEEKKATVMLDNERLRDIIV